jgi:hypothetical protein
MIQILPYLVFAVCLKRLGENQCLVVPAFYRNRFILFVHDPVQHLLHGPKNWVRKMTLSEFTAGGALEIEL